MQLVLRVALLALCLAVCLTPVHTRASSDEGDSDSDVTLLDDSNFEHLTQATSGATTGDWFIEFYAPWCGHCQRLSPVWEQLATELASDSQRVASIAKVDGTKAPHTLKRFNIKGYPTLLYLTKGQYYEYDQARDIKSLRSYIQNAEFERSKPLAIPKPKKAMTFDISVVTEPLRAIWEDVKYVFMTKPIATSIIANAGLIGGILLSTALKYLVTATDARTATQARATANKSQKRA